MKEYLELLDDVERRRAALEEKERFLSHVETVSSEDELVSSGKNMKWFSRWRKPEGGSFEKTLQIDYALRRAIIKALEKDIEQDKRALKVIISRALRRYYEESELTQ